MSNIFRNFDLKKFWEDSEYARQSWVEEPADAELVASIEKELGVRLPRSYLELMNVQNGGIPRDRCFPTKQMTSWAEDHVAISGIAGIGRTKPYSLCGELGSAFMREEWGYPDIGICVCDCPSAGHDMIMLDYRKCGPHGEPEVVHVDQERDYRITFLAKDFEAFVRGLVNDSVYDTSAEDLKRDLANIERGTFSTALADAISKCGRPDLGPFLRNICRKLALEKGYFALHGDEASHFVYDLLFYVFTASNRVQRTGEFDKAYRNLVAFGDGEFSTGGYAPDFIKDWIAGRMARGDIVRTPAGDLVFGDAFLRTFETKLRPNR